MHTIPQNEALANMPVAELEAAIEQFLQPVTDRLPDKRLGKVVRLAVPTNCATRLGNQEAEPYRIGAR